MKSIDGLLNTIKQRHNISSDYKLALFLGVGQGNIANYRHQRSLPNAEIAAKIAQALDMDPHILILHFEAQRAQTEEAKAVWLRIAERLQAGTVHVALVFVMALIALLGTSPNAYATVTDLSASVSKSSVYYVNHLLRVLARLRAFFRRSRHSTFDSMRRVVTTLHHVQSAHPAAAGLAAA